MCDNLHLDSLKQTETPLNTLFFSKFNQDLLQRGIRQVFKNKSGIVIDRQNSDDLYSMMRVVFINNAGDHHVRINEQVRFMNSRVIDAAVSQIQTGVAQYMSYVQDIDTIAVPLAQPINTSTVGKKLPKNMKIGIN